MPVTLHRLLPNPEILGKAILEQSGITCSAIPPADIGKKVPLFTLYRLGGASVHPQFFDRATMQCIAWASTYVMARELAETARVLFWQAARAQWSTADGVLHNVTEVAAPAEVRTEGQPDGVFRFDQTLTLWTRPAQV